MPKMNWKLPSLDPDHQVIEQFSNYLIFDDTFMPFHQIHQKTSHVCFEDLLKTLHLPETAQLAVASHEMSYPSQWHDHDYIELLYVLEGRLLHLTKETTTVLDSGSLCYIPIGESHLIAPIDSQPTTVVNTLVHPDLFQKMIALDSNMSKKLFQTPLILEPSLVNDQLILQLRTFILNYYKNEYQPTLVTIAHLMTFLHSLLNQNQPRYHPSDPLSKACLRLIKEQAATINLQQLSLQLNYSQGHLSRHIRQQTGLTVSQHIAQAKLTNACQLLLDSELTIRQIAEQSGYQSESHFHNLFKKETTLTPRQYRQLVQSNRE
ncbi:helix-turn-helix transcriptional regulator [Streptococcus ovuberis]|uniref:AraC family transcriptional regulator n=1 Tax=Streptococcus ovuberis TaxID=1936207 RepID=A0A7X6MWY9_9STRE|nr:AraC family transcriptional regulator [Streptococcus ovuberis]NKZ19915.1 AraC family transcriptional regulator [Streptococcus ovuberis]